MRSGKGKLSVMTILLILFAWIQMMQSLTHLLLVRVTECLKADGGITLVPVSYLLPLLRLALLEA